VGEWLSEWAVQQVKVRMSVPTHRCISDEDGVLDTEAAQVNCQW